MAGSIPFNSTVVAAINVKEFGKAVAWYRDVLELTPVYTLDEMGWGEFATAVPNFTIGLQTDPDNAGKAGGSTVTLGVDDIVVTKTTLESRGVKFEGDINEIPGMVKLATFFDPDGNRFMLAQSLSDQVPGQ
jgi:predicted enzyme related to lactoylglutathione lyase